jgi:hypothetical protein
MKGNNAQVKEKWRTVYVTKGGYENEEKEGDCGRAIKLSQSSRTLLLYFLIVRRWAEQVGASN